MPSSSVSIMISGIYQIRNVETGKVYVGSSNNIPNRWRWHKDALRRGVHHSRYLQNAWNKYGAEKFVFEEIQEVKNVLHLEATEQTYLNYYQAGNNIRCYNICPTANSCLGVKLTEEHKRKIGENSHWKGKSGPMAGRKHTEEAKRKMSESRSGSRNGMFGKEGLRGEKSPRAKLTWDIVREIRARAMSGEKQEHLAGYYGVGKTTVNNVVHHRTWREEQ